MTVRGGVVGADRPLAVAEVEALAAASGLRLGVYRSRHVAERVRRALRSEHVGDVAGLVALLGCDRGARSRFRRAVAVSVSGMFRDPSQFRLLEDEILPSLTRRGVRVWSAGAADGRELYSVGVLLERAGRLGGAYLLGSDLLEENVAAARRGDYADFAPGAALRAAVRWEQRDLVGSRAPAGAWDLVLCRNVAIYLERSARDAMHARLAGALAPGGVLLLGRSERILVPGAVGLEPAGRNAYRKPR